jgi:hypothetical protein
LEKASGAWCQPKTSHKVMNEHIDFRFAIILDEIWSKAWLGNATTKELLDEISARVYLNYKTVGNN